MTNASERNKYLAVIVMFLIAGSALYLGIENGNFTFNTNKNVSMYQGLKITYTDFTTDYIYPDSRTYLTQSIFSSNNKQVQQLQSFIFFNTMSEKAVQSVEFTANAEVDLYSSDKTTLIKQVAVMPISYVVTEPKNATDIILMSASMNSGDFESIIPSGSSTNLYYVVKCNSISAKLTFFDGSQETTRLIGEQGTENQLWWHFYTEEQSGSLSIISSEVQFKWV